MCRHPDDTMCIIISHSEFKMLKRFIANLNIVNLVIVNLVSANLVIVNLVIFSRCPVIQITRCA